MEVRADRICGYLSLLDLASFAHSSVWARRAIDGVVAHAFQRSFGGILGGNTGNRIRALYRSHQQKEAQKGTCIAAEGFSAAIDRRGSLLVWGRCGAYGERRLLVPASPPISAEIRAQDLQSHRRVACIAASRHAILAVSEHRKVFYGVCHRTADLRISTLELIPLPELAHLDIIRIFTRFGQAFAVTAAGEVYAWGLGTGDRMRGDLECSMGFGSISEQPLPSLIPSLRRQITTIAVGAAHTIFIASNGEAFSVGRTADGRLGIGITDEEHALEPARVQLGETVARAFSAAAGVSHSLFMLDSGGVKGCGRAEGGTLPGIRMTSGSVWVPVQVAPELKFCVGVAAGSSSSLFVDDCGAVYYSGTILGRPESLGRHRSWPVWKIFRISGLPWTTGASISIDFSSATFEHVLFRLRDGSVLEWGTEESNSEGASSYSAESRVWIGPKDGSYAKFAAAALGSVA